MLDYLSNRFGLPIAAVVAILVVIAVQLGLQIFSLIDLARRSRVPGGRKWPWVLLIIAGNLLGAIIYLAIGRGGVAFDVDLTPPTSPEAREDALDRLYGNRDRR